MLLLISPAKKLDADTPSQIKKTSQPVFLDDARLLINDLLQLAPQEVSALMGISDSLGVLNYDRYQQWQTPFTADNAKQALFMFKGDVYVGLDAESLSSDDLVFAQKHLRILSGLYGLLKPLDLMQAYRLEMGAKFPNARGSNLYKFWGDKITDALNTQLKQSNSQVLVNLASNEYFKSVNTKTLNADVITPVFKDQKNGQYKIISFYAKKARGLMAAFIIKEKITEVEQLKNFTSGGYIYSAELSAGANWVFTRDEQ